MSSFEEDPLPSVSEKANHRHHADETPGYYKHQLFNELYFLVDGGTVWTDSENGTVNPPTVIDATTIPSDTPYVSRHASRIHSPRNADTGTGTASAGPLTPPRNIDDVTLSNPQPLANNNIMSDSQASNDISRKYNITSTFTLIHLLIYLLCICLLIYIYMIWNQ